MSRDLTLEAYETYKYWAKVWRIKPLEFEEWMKVSDSWMSNHRDKTLVLAHVQ